MTCPSSNNHPDYRLMLVFDPANDLGSAARFATA